MNDLELLGYGFLFAVIVCGIFFYFNRESY